MKDRKPTIGMLARVLIVFILSSGGTAFAQPVEQPAPVVQPVEQPASLVKPGEPLNTAHKLRLQLEGYLGFGLDSVKVGQTSKGDDVKISGGGGLGGGATLGYGLSKSFDIDATFGAQVSGLTPAVDNATGTFGRTFLLATLKYKIPVRENLQWKFGVGVGYYMGAKLDIDIDQGILNGGHTVVDYKDTTGFHVTGELEIALQRNLVLAVGLKYYKVDYKADTATFNGISQPVSSEFKDFNGDGLDVTVGLGVLF